MYNDTDDRGSGAPVWAGHTFVRTLTLPEICAVDIRKMQHGKCLMPKYVGNHIEKKKS